MSACLNFSQEYFFATADEQLRRDFPSLYPRIAAGLVGNGSDCYGFDDELSRDHDWGQDFFLWVLPEDVASIPALCDWKTRLLDEYPPAWPKARSKYGVKETILEVGSFYKQMIGRPNAPSSLEEWLNIPENLLSMATNGVVFVDNPGEFTDIRNKLLDYYPEDLRKKRLAACCMALAQTGQYNFQRTVARGDWVTVNIILSHFAEQAMRLVFLLRRRYRPYYKWTFKALLLLGDFGRKIGRGLLDISLVSASKPENQPVIANHISEICGWLADEIRTQGLAGSDDWFLATLGEEIQASIENRALRELPAQTEI
jgi:hypothetical protein